MASPKSTSEAPPEKQAVAKILREHVVPCFAEHGLDRLVFARAKISRKDLPPGMRLTRLPPLGKSIKSHSQSSPIQAAWPADGMESLHVPGFFYVYEGAADIPVGNAILHCPAGYGAIIPAGVPRTPGLVSHWLRPHPEKAHSDILWVNVTSFGAEYHHCHTRGTWHHSDCGWYSIVASRQLSFLTEQLIEELEHQSPEYRIVSAAYLHAIANLLLRHISSDILHSAPRAARESESESGGPARHEGTVERAQAYIENQLSDHITLEDIARAAYVSRARLAQIFREQVGQSVWDYVTTRRLQRAKTMLAETDLFIYQVSSLTGFASPTTFIARFVEHAGMSPGEYRRRAKEESTPKDAME